VDGRHENNLPVTNKPHQDKAQQDRVSGAARDTVIQNAGFIILVTGVMSLGHKTFSNSIFFKDDNKIVNVLVQTSYAA